jgi:hypothetical protein
MAGMRRGDPGDSAAITVEGALIAPAMLARVAAQQADGQDAADYRIPKGLTVRDEIARYFRIGQALHAELNAAPSPSAARTVAFAEALLRDVLGFADVTRVGTRTVDGRSFPVTLEALGGRLPVVVVPPGDALDRPSAHLAADQRRRSAASALQDWLNVNDAAAWGLCCNGRALRLLRDNASLTRPAYIEVDLTQVFEGDAFADFAALWLLLHASRFGQPGTPATDCALERWREAGSKEGAAARERLRDGVEAALLALGSGFLSVNPELRQRVQNGTLPLPDFFGQLLRLVYRLIFLLAAEDRGLLHPPDAPAEARGLYGEGYSLSALRDRAVRRAAWDGHFDRWEGLRIVFATLAEGEPRLGLPGLGGLFAPELTADLSACRLANRALMEAIFRLAWLREKAGLTPVNWRDMETEELGSVYEGLLELTPRLVEDGRALAFAEGGEAKGHARKTTGSYYTPDALVQLLLDSALDPVLDRVQAEADDPAAALLGVTVIDPACGSGHFLLAAGRRIATRLARARAGGVASAEDYRHALRDVARACLHGVDRNPMAVELTKVALWIETVEPGKPLGFLDANIRCGDSLLGLFSLEELKKGIPDAAYSPLTGDDKATAKAYAARNRDDRSGQGSLDFVRGGGQLPAAPLAEVRSVLRALPEDSADQVAEKRRRFEAARGGHLCLAWGMAAHLYVAAFLAPKRSTVPVPTSGDLWRALSGEDVDPWIAAAASETAMKARAFHWPLEFPDVIASGGFDVVLGNPPWEVLELSEEEYFAQRLPELAELAGAVRKKAIAALRTEHPSLYGDYETEKRRFEAANEFARASGRFDLSARGKINTYALFAEHFTGLASARGRAGMLVPTGIATDATTAPFFAALVERRNLVSLHDFQTGLGFFDRIGHARFKFCLLTIGPKGSGPARPSFSFFSRTASEFADRRRHFSLSLDELALLSPNTHTAPTFRTHADAELTAKIYGHAPVLIDESKGSAGNSWGAEFRQGLFNMTSDSGLFRTGAQLASGGFERSGTDWTNCTMRYVPLYEAKMIHQFDHRWATYDGEESRNTTETEKRDPGFEPTPRYWVPEGEVGERLGEKRWTRGWLMGWRDICRSTDERTAIATIFPRIGVGHVLPLMFVKPPPELWAPLVSNLDCLVLDYIARQKIGGTHLTYAYLKQLPLLPPTAYIEANLAFVAPRALEMIFTSHSMGPFARDLSYDGPPFDWNDHRRAYVRAELDAWYARAYGLTRDELRYILDPEDAMGPGYPSETFRVLKKNEIARFGEYRTARLVLAAWDRLADQLGPAIPAAACS